MFFIIGVIYFCVFNFLLFHIFVYFRVPVPPRPLGQIGPICDRFWSNFCSILLPMQLSFQASSLGRVRYLFFPCLCSLSFSYQYHFPSIGPAECARRVSVRRPLSGDEACQIGIENLQTPKPQPRPHTLPGQSQNINCFTSEPQFSDFFKFLVHFFLSQKTSKFQLRPKWLKISKI